MKPRGTRTQGSPFQSVCVVRGDGEVWCSGALTKGSTRKPVLPGCAQDSDCDDGNPCTAQSTCSAGICKGTVGPCDDGNLCTSQDACTPLNGKAVCAGTPAVTCNDKKPCTADSCDPKTGQGVFAPIEGCLIGCTSNADCDDGLINLDESGATANCLCPLVPPHRRLF